MLIGVSGPQGCGKTTLVNELAERGYQVDHFKVSRAVQQEMGFSKLTDVAVDMATMIRFQERVFQRKLENDRRVAEQPGVWVVERTFADIAAYATWWYYQITKLHTWKPEGDEDLEAAMWLAEFYQSCAKAQAMYDLVALLPHSDHIPVEEDAQRADVSFANWTYEQLEQFSQNAQPQVMFITEKSVTGRADQFMQLQYEKTDTLVLPDIESKLMATSLLDAAEAAYWKFDALKKGYVGRSPMAERAAFKNAVLGIANALLNSVKRTK